MGLARCGYKPTIIQVTASNGAAAILLAAASDGGKRSTSAGVHIKALPTNTAVVWIGTDSSVTASNGYPLSAGESITLPVDDPSKIYTYGAAASQVVAVVY